MKPPEQQSWLKVCTIKAKVSFAITMHCSPRSGNEISVLAIFEIQTRVVGRFIPTLKKFVFALPEFFPCVYYRIDR